MNIGCIGTGNMGRAIITGLSKKYNKEQLKCYDSNSDQLSLVEAVAECIDFPEKVLSESDIVIFAVKPDVLIDLLSKLKPVIKPETVIVSIAAGITISQIEEAAGQNKKIIRIMPNTPAMVLQAVSVLSPNGNVSDQELASVNEMFSSIGKTLVLKESMLDTVTAISGCGPAYMFTIIQAIADAGVENGLSRKDSVLLAAQTMKGAAEMIMALESEPYTLRNMVASPGGSTIAALHVIDRSGLSGILMDAVNKAKEVSSSLGKKK